MIVGSQVVKQMPSLLNEESSNQSKLLTLAVKPTEMCTLGNKHRLQDYKVELLSKNLSAAVRAAM